MSKLLTVGRLSKATGIGVETVRFYEAKGLLDAPSRTPSGYRHYSEDSIVRIRFIQSAKSLGFSLSEIKELLVLRVSSEHPCEQVRGQALAKVADIEQKISALISMKSALLALVSRCGAATESNCAMLHILEGQAQHEG